MLQTHTIIFGGNILHRRMDIYIYIHNISNHIHTYMRQFYPQDKTFFPHRTVLLLLRVTWHWRKLHPKTLVIVIHMFHSFWSWYLAYRNAYDVWTISLMVCVLIFSVLKVISEIIELSRIIYQLFVKHLNLLKLEW